MSTGIFYHTSAKENILSMNGTQDNYKKGSSTYCNEIPYIFIIDFHSINSLFFNVISTIRDLSNLWGSRSGLSRNVLCLGPHCGKDNFWRIKKETLFYIYWASFHFKLMDNGWRLFTARINVSNGFYCSLNRYQICTNKHLLEDRR